ncbi:hypothetical protein J3Q64DRAFT_1729360 [Phycomyces blakesleeanus]|uniref:DUF202 domain-containing protein n=1 Tax=Phycomyces blakesleeanus TaxID=4837 RepID=A0ABR3B5A5_PHYBL
MAESQHLLSQPTSQNYSSTATDNGQSSRPNSSSSTCTITSINNGGTQDPPQSSSSAITEAEAATETTALLASSSSSYSSSSSSKTALKLASECPTRPPHPWLTFLEEFIEEYSTSRYLENKNSVARDHLANERTYLAWLRTSLATISCGVAITQFFRLDKSIRDGSLLWFGRPVGLCFILMGMMFLMFAFVRYFHVQASMIKGYFPASRGIVIVTTSSVLMALIALFIIITFSS